MQSLDNFELRICRIINRYHEGLLKNNNIVSVGRGTKEIKGKDTKVPALVFLVKEKIYEGAISSTMLIPKFISGAITDVREAGEKNRSRKFYNKLETNYPLKGLPALGGGGISIEVDQQSDYISTLGYAVTEKNRRESIYFLASSHFLDYKGEFKVGKKVYYWINSNGNKQDILLGLMKKVIPIKYEGKFIPPQYNLVDAGIGYVGPNNSKTRAILSPGLITGKLVRGIESVKKGAKVYKVGSITGNTQGVVTMVDAVGKFENPSKSTFYLKEQIVVEIVGEDGDSGALGINSSNDKAFGMLNGGQGKYGYFSNISTVLKGLDIELLL